MATSSEPRVDTFEENQLSLKLKGTLQDVLITEEDIEETDSEDNDSNSSGLNMGRAMSVPSVPIVKYLDQPIFGSVQVKESKNVHFGDNITGDNLVFNFKGPVVINQVLAEQDNAGYEQTENDAPSTNVRQQKIGTKETNKIKSSNLKLWLKLSSSAVCIVIVGSICAIVSITWTYSGHESTTTRRNDEQDASTGDYGATVDSQPFEECKSVEGFTDGLLRFIMILSLLMVLIYMSCTKLLTTEIGDKNLNVKDDTTVPVLKNSYNVEADPLLIAPNHLRIVSRIDWLAQPVEKPLDKIQLPVPWVIISHTATEGCYSQSECVLRVRLIQMFHVESRGWFDIGYNFLVAGDGSAYVGRGWEYQGAHTLGYNKYSMGIAFIGTFNNEPPPKKQLDACKKLIQHGVTLGKIAKDYKLFAHRQLSSTTSPGDKLFEILKEWPHFVKNVTNVDDLLPDY